uniref:Uncharacterized protein n=1 Tax=Anguilla anguilla TaxID=7936 RepID=A0A0E9W4A8_ANGAN
MLNMPFPSGFFSQHKYSFTQLTLPVFPVT